MEQRIVRHRDPSLRSPARDGFAAYQAAAWRAPATARFDSRPANDAFVPVEATPQKPALDDPIKLGTMPRWLIIALGGVAAAIVGALLGGVISI